MAENPRKRVHIDVNENVVVDAPSQGGGRTGGPTKAQLPLSAQEFSTLGLQLCSSDVLSDRLHSLVMLDQALKMHQTHQPSAPPTASGDEHATEIDVPACCFAAAEVCLENGDSERAMRYAERSVLACEQHLDGSSLDPAPTGHDKEKLASAEIVRRAAWIAQKHRHQGDDPTRLVALDALVQQWYDWALPVLLASSGPSNFRLIKEYAVFLALSQGGTPSGEWLEEQLLGKTEVTSSQFLSCQMMQALLYSARGGCSGKVQALLDSVDQTLSRLASGQDETISASTCGRLQVGVTLQCCRVTLASKVAQLEASGKKANQAKGSVNDNKDKVVSGISTALLLLETFTQRLIRQDSTPPPATQGSPHAAGEGRRQAKQMFQVVAALYGLLSSTVRGIALTTAAEGGVSNGKLIISLCLEAVGQFLNSGVSSLSESSTQALLVSSLQSEAALLVVSGTLPPSASRLRAAVQKAHSSVHGSPTPEALTLLGDLLMRLRTTGAKDEVGGGAAGIATILSNYTRALQIDPRYLPALKGAASVYESAEVNEPELAAEYWMAASAIELESKPLIPYSALLIG